MQSNNQYNNHCHRCESGAGFTLVEILISIAILAAIFSIGLFFSFDFYKSYAFGAEKNTIISVLQKARSRALNNINQEPHGVHFENNPTRYILFEGTTYSPAKTSNVTVIASPGISIVGAPYEVIFQQLSASSVDSTITINDGAKSYTITVNFEGRISW